MFGFRLQIPVDVDTKSVFEQLRGYTHEVRFYFLDFVNMGHKRIEEPWIGSINEEHQKFKLFRMVRNKNTSDFVVHGRVNETRVGSDIRISIRPHYSIYLGLGAIVLCAHFFATKISEKHDLNYWMLETTAQVIACGIYLYSQRRDYVKTRNSLIAMFKPLINKP